MMVLKWSTPPLAALCPKICSIGPCVGGRAGTAAAQFFSGSPMRPGHDAHLTARILGEKHENDFPEVSWPVKCTLVLTVDGVPSRTHPSTDGDGAPLSPDVCVS